MSLLRVACALTGGIGFHVAFTSPNPPPAENEWAPGFRWDFGSIIPIRYTTKFEKAICWAVVIAESTVILANKTSSLSVSRFILSTLFVNGEPNNLCLTPAFVSGTLLMAAGGFLRWKCYRTMTRHFTFETTIQKDHRLVTTGPYALVRHPGYTGTFCVFLGFLLWQISPGSWVRESGVLRTFGGIGLAGSFLTLISYVTMGMLRRTSEEDRMMKKQFGRQWIEWAQKVPYKLIPGVY